MRALTRLALAAVGSALLLLPTSIGASAETPVERGRYLVTTIGACGNCHTPRDAQGNPIPTYGQDLHTFTCLKAVALEAQRVPLEVIVMDDHAAVPASQALAAVTGVRFERNDTNLGFLLNCNRGAQLARPFIDQCHELLFAPAHLAEPQPDTGGHTNREEQRAEGEEGARLAKVRHDLEVIRRSARVPDAVVVRGDDSKAEVSQR